MPSKKGAPKSKEPTATQAQSKLTIPKTINERTLLRYQDGNPLSARRQELGLHALTPTEKAQWTGITYLRNASDQRKLPLGNKAVKELWKVVNDSGVPLRGLGNCNDEEGSRSVRGSGDSAVRGESGTTGAAVYDWGVDKVGRDVGEYTAEEFEARRGKRLRVARLQVEGRAFGVARRRRERLIRQGEERPEEDLDREDDEIEQEKERRIELQLLRMELYGNDEGSGWKKGGGWKVDPLWDDVVPIEQEEGEDALASIAYSEEYAEAISYLRAVMASKEHSPRALRLTESVISLNPAHYTVWLYRFAIISSLNISIPDEFDWLNRVSLVHLKNYQIWHHRQLLLDQHYPSFLNGGVDEDKLGPETCPELKAFALAELDFLTRMLAQDEKNYHVWSYRQYLVRKLRLWDLREEMQSVETLIEKDVRNNSAWSHRFFLVFSNPAHCTMPELPASEKDPQVPAAVLDREVEFSKKKIELAPQNQSGWNYLRGVVARGGGVVQDGIDRWGVEAFALGFVDGLGEGDEKEVVRSSYALDLLAEVWGDGGELEKADLAFRRLGEKWDRVRVGYWGWRREGLAKGKV